MHEKIGICYVCGNRLINRVTRKPVIGTTREVNGTVVRMHKCCSETFDRDQQKLRQVNHTTDQFGQPLESYEE